MNKFTYGEFIQEKSVGKRTLKSFGNFLFTDKGVVWETKKPISSTLVLTENSMTQILNNGKKTIQNSNENPTFKNIASVFSSIFSGNIFVIENNFFYEIRGTQNWTLELKPKDLTIQSVIKKITLTGNFTEENVSILTFELLDKSENSQKYYFSNQTYPLELSENEKKFFE